MRNYLIAAVVFVGGLALFGVLLFRGLTGLGDLLQPVIVPGTHRLSIEESGHYTMYYEQRSLVGDQLFNTGEAIPALTIGLTRVDTSDPVELNTAGSGSTFSLGSRQGVAVLDFEIEAPGEYELSVEHTEGSGPQLVLSWGKGFNKRLLGTVFSGIGVMFVTLGLSISLAVVTLIRQIRAKRQAGESGGISPTSPE